MEAIEFYIGEMEDALERLDGAGLEDRERAIEHLRRAAEQVIVAYDEATRGDA